MQAIIILPATSRYSPAKIGNFIFSEEFGAHIWGGRPLDMEEFNEISKRIFYSRRNEIEDFDLPPYVQLVSRPDHAHNASRSEAGGESSEILKAKPESNEARPPRLKRKTPLIQIPELTV
jgi:hypothetical protein